jgi:hypothetical protein
MDLQNVILMLSIIVIILITYKILISNENFTQIDICDYNSPDPNNFCKSIQKGCTDLIYENKDLNNSIDKNCTTLPTNTRDMIDTSIVCSDTVNKVIMNNYVQKEICTQIKNYPEDLPPRENIPSTEIKPVEFTKEDEEYFLNSEKGFAPF